MLNLPKFLVDYKLVIKIKNKLVFLLKLLLQESLKRVLLLFKFWKVDLRSVLWWQKDRWESESGWEALLVAPHRLWQWPWLTLQPDWPSPLPCPLPWHMHTSWFTQVLVPPRSLSFACHVILSKCEIETIIHTQHRTELESSGGDLFLFILFLNFSCDLP